MHKIYIYPLPCSKGRSAIHINNTCMTKGIFVNTQDILHVQYTSHFYPAYLLRSSKAFFNTYVLYVYILIPVSFHSLVAAPVSSLSALKVSED